MRILNKYVAYLKLTLQVKYASVKIKLSKKKVRQEAPQLAVILFPFLCLLKFLHAYSDWACSISK